MNSQYRINYVNIGNSIMSNGIIEEVKAQLDSGTLPQEQSNRWILRILVEMYERDEQADKDMKALKEKVDDLADMFDRYPSLLWLAFNRTWVFLMMFAIFIAVVSIAVDPMNVIEFGQFLRGNLGGMP